MAEQKDDEEREEPSSPFEQVPGLDDPEQVPKLIQRTFGMMMASGPLPNPILEKIDSEHISKVLELSGQDSAREERDRTQSRRYGLLYAVLGIAVFAGLTVVLPTIDKGLYIEIVKILGTGGLGFAGGYGYGSRSKD